MLQTSSQHSPLTQDIATLVMIEEELNAMFLERSEAVRMALLALLAKQHAVLLGPPGTGKSALIRELCSRFCDPQGNGLLFFYYQLHKLTQLDELIGPVSFEGIKQGTYSRVLDRSLADCDVAFLDEIWKTSSAIHNAMLRAANERMVKNGVIDLSIPLNTIFGASNELPDGHELAAARDRYLLTAFVAPLSSEAFARFTRRQMGLDPNPFHFPRTTLSKEAFLRLQQYASTIPFTDTIASTMSTIREALAAANIIISDRRAAWCYPLLQVHAMLEGRDKVTEDDFAALVSALWSEPGQIKTVAAVITQYSSPTIMRVSAWKDDAQLVYDTAVEQMREAEAKDRMLIASEAAAKLYHIRTDLENLQADLTRRGKVNKRVDQALAQVQSQHLAILKSVGFPGLPK